MFPSAGRDEVKDGVWDRKHDSTHEGMISPVCTKSDVQWLYVFTELYTCLSRNSSQDTAMDVGQTMKELDEITSGHLHCTSNRSKPANGL